MLQEITLSAQRTRLEPLRSEHAPALFKAEKHPEIFAFYPRPMATLGDIHNFIAETLDAQKLGVQLPFAIRDSETGDLVGSTRFMDYSALNRSAEIGATWLSSAVWRTRINTECKYLFLKHGFETLDLVRIAFKTDARNMRSQRAIERLGAQKQGVLRSQMILSDGFRRDSVFYSILDHEWLEIKARLEGFLSN